MAQQPSRPWFRLASMVRPPPPPSRPPAPAQAPAPAPAPVQPQPFRPQVPLTPAGQPTLQPPPPIFPTVTPRTSAPPSPILPTTPAPVSSPVAPPPARDTAPPSPTPEAPPPPQATAPPSPSKTPLATLTSPATSSPKSPDKTGEIQPTLSTKRSPTTTSAQSPPPPIPPKPTSPITKTSSSLPASPGKKASPQIAVTRPDVSYSSLPSSPKTKPSAPPPSPLPTSPAFKTVPSSPVHPPPSPVRSAAPIPTVTARATSPMASPKINKPWVETPPQSTKEKLLSHPPSPLTLPPAQIKAGSDLEPIPAEVEQKTVTEEKSKTTPKTSNGYVIRSHGETHNGIAQHGKREFRKDKGVHTHKKHSDSEEFGARVVTLAGENKGAMMELSPSRKKIGFGAWCNGGQKQKNDSDEGSSRMKDEKHRAVPTETAPMDAFVNCNVQGVNNSILYNCSCTHNDPGVHLSVSRKRNGGHGAHH